MEGKNRNRIEVELFSTLMFPYELSKTHSRFQTLKISLCISSHVQLRFQPFGKIKELHHLLDAISL